MTPSEHKPAHNRRNLFGQKFGKLTVLSYSGRRKPNNKCEGSWLCQCECGKQTIVNTYNLINGHTKSCGCSKHRTAYNNKGYGEISGLYWCHLQAGAKSRNINMYITKEEAWELFIQQNRKCALTGVELTHDKYMGKLGAQKLNIILKNNLLRGNASLDRIDSSKPYTKDNCQWIDKHLQKLKNNLPEPKFIQLCKLVVEYDNAKRSNKYAN
jgi:hypothetical protein